MSSMTRIQLLQLLIGQARKQGFEFRKWYAVHVAIPWSGAEHAIEWLSKGSRSHTLLFSHDFARQFWCSGDRITFKVPSGSFHRVRADGTIEHIERKAYFRRSSRPDVWRYHLREMAAAPEPLRYIRRYLLVEELHPAEPSASAVPAESTDLDDYDNENLVRLTP